MRWRDWAAVVGIAHGYACGMTLMGFCIAAMLWGGGKITLDFNVVREGWAEVVLGVLGILAAPFLAVWLWNRVFESRGVPVRTRTRKKGEADEAI